MGDEETTINILKSNIGVVLADYPVSTAYLYGSTATGLTTPFSDVDVALLLEKPLSDEERLRLELRIETELAEKLGVRNADVRVVNDAPLPLRGQVVCRGILLYCKDHGARVDFETSTRSAYFDFLPVIEEQRRAFFADLRERGLHGKPGKA